MHDLSIIFQQGKEHFPLMKLQITIIFLPPHMRRLRTLHGSNIEVYYSSSLSRFCFLLNICKWKGKLHACSNWGWKVLLFLFLSLLGTRIRRLILRLNQLCASNLSNLWKHLIFHNKRNFFCVCVCPSVFYCSSLILCETVREKNPFLLVI